MSARLGHADIATTQRIYVHAFDAANRSDERRANLAALYSDGNSMETTDRNERSKAKSRMRLSPRNYGLSGVSR